MTNEHTASQESEDEKDVIKLNRYDISVNLIQPTIETWVSNIDNGDIIIPPFQRNFRWKIEQSSKLIESFLFGLPVPPLFLYEDHRRDNKLLVIDGQQRLLSIYFFFKKKFPSSGMAMFEDEKTVVEIVNALSDDHFKPFALAHVNDRWENATFDDMDESDKNWLKRRPLWAITVRQIRPDDERINSMFYIFERLNTGGELLTPMEIRKAISYGKFCKFLEEINENPDWRAIYGFERDGKLRDVELILRFFSLQELENYKEPMKAYLNSFMHQYRNIDADKINVMRKLFSDTCRIIHESLGKKMFHINGPINAAMMDSFMVTTSKKISMISVEKLKHIYELCKQSQELKAALESRVNVKEDVLKKRFSIVAAIFDSVIKQ